MLKEKLTKKEISDFLSDNFFLGKVISIIQEKQGMANLSYRITTDQGKFLLRLSLRHNWYQIKYEVKLLRSLSSLPTPSLLADKKGRYLFRCNGKPAIIYSYLPGKMIKRLSMQQLKALGEFLGRYHQQTKNFFVAIKRYQFYQCSEKMIKKTYQHLITSSLRKYKKEIDYLITIIKIYRLSVNLPQGAIHIDIKPENLFFTGNKLTGVIDFDNAYTGPLVLDLANTIIWNCARSGKIDFTKMKILLSAYQKFRKLTLQEKQQLWSALNFLLASHIYEDMYGYVYGYNSKSLPLSLIDWEMDKLFPAQLQLMTKYDKFKKIIK